MTVFGRLFGIQGSHQTARPGKRFGGLEEAFPVCALEVTSAGATDLCEAGEVATHPSNCERIRDGRWCWCLCWCRHGITSCCGA